MPWIRRSTTQAVLVHISDLHFGHKGQLEIWDRTSQYIRTTIKPDLAVATGDIADTPKKAYLTAAHAALAALDPGFRVCAGNHDLHGRGNILPWRLTSKPHLFNDVFAGRIPGITGETRLLGPTKIGLFSMDSSMRADTFARGYCAPDLLLQLRTNIATHPDARQWDYCIVMVHHQALLQV